MVDIIKFRPNISSPTQNIRDLQYISNSQQLNVTGLLGKWYGFSENERFNNTQRKIWIDLFPQNRSRLLDVANIPYSLHRKVIHHELSRPCTAAITSRAIGGSKIKQQPPDILTKNVAALGGGTNIASQTTFYNNDIQNSEGLNSLSKYITVKAEPLRSSHSMTKSPANAITSWQRYWASTYAQRRRKEANDLEGDTNFKRSMLGPTYFVVNRDSTLSKSRRQTNDEIPSIELSSCNITNISTTAAVNKNVSSTREYNMNGSTSRPSSIELKGSSIVPPSVEIKSSTRVAKPILLISPSAPNKNDKKPQRRKSALAPLSSSSTALHIDSVSQIIEEVSYTQNSTIPIATKIFKVAVLSEKTETVKNSVMRRRSRSKSVEKKLRRIPSTSRRKRVASANQCSSSKSKEILIPTELTTSSKKKCKEKKWDSPYTGIRFDPPTPPCSPLAYDLPQDADEEDVSASFEKSEIFESNAHFAPLKKYDF